VSRAANRRKKGVKNDRKLLENIGKAYCKRFCEMFKKTRLEKTNFWNFSEKNV